MGYPPIPAGASLLAKSINDNAGIQTTRGVMAFFASTLTPTETPLDAAFTAEMDMYTAPA
jgi:hypothetical protein